ncbi:methanethiol S-methyltransferase [Tsuneonella mangrovi]|uniref:methanethiol S-methyltransferase n=1 Tax=Tsuneonella mangrovi TaxID=1982042 RepID=UPI000BA20794|nr:methanethiol S-methyltransferase [Tsuneonella mangrovi]
MARTLTLLTSVLCYFAFFVSFVYLIGFVGGIDLLPTTVNKGMAAAPGVAAIVDLALIALFGLQHSVMARPAFKAGWTKIVPAPLERSVYCLTTAICLAIMFAFWHPISGTVWQFESPALRNTMWALFGAGWVILFIATHLINHFELFGLQQAWTHFTGKPANPISFKTPLFYKWVRHPIYSGILLAVWATPDMTYSHLLLAIGFTIYILIGISYEERDLVVHFGERYVEYRKQVGKVIPGIGKFN